MSFCRRHGVPRPCFAKRGVSGTLTLSCLFGPTGPLLAIASAVVPLIVAIFKSTKIAAKREVGASNQRKEHVRRSTSGWWEIQCKEI